MYVFIFLKIMKGRMVKMNKDKREKEDTTKYGEFVSSFFGWITPENQKHRVNEIEKMTNNEEKNKNKQKKGDI